NPRYIRNTPTTVTFHSGRKKLATNVHTTRVAAAPYPMNPRERIVTNGRIKATLSQKINLCSARCRQDTQHWRHSPTTKRYWPTEINAFAVGSDPTVDDRRRYDPAPARRYTAGRAG